MTATGLSQVQTEPRGCLQRGGHDLQPWAGAGAGPRVAARSPTHSPGPFVDVSDRRGQDVADRLTTNAQAKDLDVVILVGGAACCLLTLRTGR
jgi:putative intracellular protease/amidase